MVHQQQEPRMKPALSARLTNSLSRNIDQSSSRRRTRTRSLAAVFALMAFAVAGAVLAGSHGFPGSAPGNDAGPGPAGRNPPQAARVRIGTYDSRAIAIAFARSEQFALQMKDL